MTPCNSLDRMFLIQGYLLTLEDQVYTIENSYSLPKNVAERIISKAKYCPIFSENRVDKNLEFTLVPFRDHHKFEKINFQLVSMTDENFFSLIESTKTYVDEGKSIMYLGELTKLTEVMKRIMLKCNTISSQVLEFCEQKLKKGTILDLGCGRGANSIPCLEKGWKVIGVDQFPEVLDLYRQVAGKYLENGQLELIHDDITNYKFTKNNFDIALCVDVLPYIIPDKLTKLMNDINETLVLNGRFFGTLFFSDSDEDGPEKELFGKLGGHFYPGADFTPALLDKSGFHIEECSLRVESTKIKCAEFIVTKK